MDFRMGFHPRYVRPFPSLATLTISQNPSQNPSFSLTKQHKTKTLSQNPLQNPSPWAEKSTAKSVTTTREIHRNSTQLRRAPYDPGLLQFYAEELFCTLLCPFAFALFCAHFCVQPRLEWPCFGTPDLKSLPIGYRIEDFWWFSWPKQMSSFYPSLTFPNQSLPYCFWYGVRFRSVLLLCSEFATHSDSLLNI